MITKKYLLLTTLPIVLVGCSSNATNSVEVGWARAEKSEVNRRLKITENVIYSPSYKVFDRKLTYSSVYKVKNELAALSSPDDFDVSETVDTSTYTYNPDNLSFNFTYDRYFVEDNIHSIRTLNITVGELNGKTILQTQHRHSQYEEYELTNTVISASNKREALEDEIDSWLFYIGLNVSYYFDNIETHTVRMECSEGFILRNSVIDVNYFIKGEDGVRIQSEASIEGYQNKSGTSNLKYEIYDSYTFDVIMINNMFVKYENSSFGYIKDYTEGSIERETKTTSFSASESSNLGKISIISK